MLTCFITTGKNILSQQTLDVWLSQPFVPFVYVPQTSGHLKGVHTLRSTNWHSGEFIHEMARCSQTEYTLLCDLSREIDMGRYSLKRMLEVAEQTGSNWVYADYYDERDGKLFPHPVIDYQEGSLRDDFDFGHLILIRTQALRKAAGFIPDSYLYAALYGLRLGIARQGSLFHINEYLYTCKKSNDGFSGQTMFRYVDPANRSVQLEMEHACTQHLKEINAWLSPQYIQTVDLRQEHFPCEATIVIPVRNRAKTIADAINSAQKQITGFPYNIIAVDNHSTDGTTQLIAGKAASIPNLIHLTPARNDLGIGGCWNEAIHHELCGRFVVQLDSDDLYAGTDTLQLIVDCFYENQAAMVIGSYLMVDFDLNEIPPGLITHREWTPDNGRNNALRINGFGAPRAFYTPVIRRLCFPNVSYGEDYAVALAVSRDFPVGRIYEPVYLCRRWNENTDSSLSVPQLNAHNLYKDRIRTIELLARKQITPHPNHVAGGG